MGVHIRDVCEQLQKIGVDNLVFCVPHDQQGNNIFEYRGYRVLECFNENPYSYESWQGMIDDMITEQIYYMNFADHLKNESFDIIHLHDSQLFNVARFLSKYYKCPLVMTCHLSLFMSHPFQNSEKFNYLIKREGASYHYCDKLMTVSNHYKKMLEDNYLLKNKDIGVVMNGVNYNELQTIEYNGDLYRQSLGNHEKIIGFVGRMVNTKGISLILKAAETFPQYQFNLISNVLPTMENILPIIQDVKDYIRTHDNLKWFKSIPDKEKWDLMKISDIGLVPSFHEPFGIVGLEWMSLGIPLIVSGVEGLQDFCNNENSLVFNPGTIENPHPENLIEKIKNYENNFNRTKEGIITAKNMSWLNVAKKYKKYYEEVLEK